MRTSNDPCPRKPEAFARRLWRWVNREGSTVAVVAVVLVGGCGAEPQPEPRFSEPEYEGLTREEIERQAAAMTLEEAESLGIVDTTIRIEAPMNPDIVLAIPPDTATP